MEKLNALKDHFIAVFKSLVDPLSSMSHIGSINFWYDEYSASLECSPWCSDEVPWGILGADNINLEDFDVFDEGDQKIIRQVAEEFSKWLITEFELSSLNFRDKTDLTLSCFSGESPLLLGQIKGNIQLKKLSDLEAQDIIIQTLEKALSALQRSPIRKISISGHNDKSTMSFFTELADERKEPNDYFSSENIELGLALSHLANYSQSDFFKFCETLTSKEFFKKLVLNQHFVFLFVCSLNKHLVAVYDYDSKQIRQLDELNESNLLY